MAATWSKWGIGVPHLSRRAFDDNTNALGTYTFAPTLAADGVTVLETALPELRRQSALRVLTEHRQTRTSSITSRRLGAFVQDQYQAQRPLRHHARPALRLAELSRHAAARLLSASLLCVGASIKNRRPFCAAAAASTTTASAVARCSTSRATAMLPGARSSCRSIPQRSPPTGCVPIYRLHRVAAQPPALAQLMPNAKIPYQIQYGLSIERQLGQRATGTISAYSMRGIRYVPLH